MRNIKILCLLKKCIIKQVYKKAIEDLKNNIKLIFNLYANRVDDLVNSLDNNEADKNILFQLNNKVYFCKQSEINSIELTKIKMKVG